MKVKPVHVEILHKEFEERRSTNARYSLRAFARYLGMAPSTLSRILNCSQELSLGSSKQVIRKLKLGGSERQAFILSVGNEKKRKAIKTLSKASGEIFTQGVYFNVEALANMALQKIADGCLVYILRDNNVSIIHFKHRPEISKTSAPKILEMWSDSDKVRNEGPVIFNSTSSGGEFLHGLNASSLMSVPILVNDKYIGHMAFIRHNDHDPFVSADIEWAKNLGRQAAYIVD